MEVQGEHAALAQPLPMLPCGYQRDAVCGSFSPPASSVYAGGHQLVHLPGHHPHPGGQDPAAGGGEPGGPGLEDERRGSASAGGGRASCTQAHAPERVPNKVTFIGSFCSFFAYLERVTSEVDERS